MVRQRHPFIRWAKRTIIRATELAGLYPFDMRSHYAQDGLFTLHNDDFRRDPVFQAAYRRALEASHGIDPRIEWRVHVALWVAGAALRAPGNFVECGVNAGFMSSAIMQRLNWNGTGRKFYLVDTFTGPVLEQYSAEEVALGRTKLARKNLAAGAYITDLERVRANFAEWPEAVVVEGTVPAVLKTFDAGQMAFLHLDMNCAYPERAALEYFWERLAPGAFVLLDDYSYGEYECQKDAIDDAARGLGAEVLSLPTGQGLIIR
jgi:hypothetical protein